MDNDLIGNILIEQGVLTQSQVDRALQAQAEREAPLGRIAEQLFDIERITVIEALAEQVVMRAPDASLATESFDPQCLRMIAAKEAWDNLILPIRWENGELLCATTVETMPGSIELLQQKLDCPFHFVIAEMRPLEEFIASLYAYEGVEVID
ncbi:MAG: hypothetical protein KTR15_07540 [Phycisphaeraceae bacterium]|nr:hypothetical protein [Phycisphaeraceae bacterium]